MPAITIRNFSGQIPLKGPRLLQSNQAQIARNCKLWSGELRAWNGHLDVLDLQATVSPTTIYWYARQHWLWWNYAVEIAKSPIANTNNRIYITGMDFPRVTDSTLVTQSQNAEAIPSYRLGVPAPTETIETEIEVLYKTEFDSSGVIGGDTIGKRAIGASDPPQQVEDTEGLLRSRAYVETFVNAWGEEGPPGPPSETIDVRAERYVDLSNFTPTPEGEWNLSKRRIYRVNTGTTGGAYQFLVELDLSETTYRDEIEDTDLGEVLSTTDYDLPPEDMRQIIELPGSILAGLSGNEICFCEPGLCYAWPEKYRLTMNHTGVSLGHFGSTLVITTEANLYLTTGTHPDSMTMEKLPIVQPCVSARGTVSMESGVFFPSPDGLVYVGPGGARIVTKELFTRDDWEKIKPETMHAYVYGGMYLGFSLASTAVADHQAESIQRLYDNLEKLTTPDGSGCIGRDAIGKFPIGASSLQPVDYEYPRDVDGLGFYVQGSPSTLVPFDFYSYCGYTDPTTGDLFLVHKVVVRDVPLIDAVGGEINDNPLDIIEINSQEGFQDTGQVETLISYHIKKLDGDTSVKIPNRWKSKLFPLASMYNWAAVAVRANYGKELTSAQQVAYEAYRQALIASNETIIDTPNPLGDELMGGSINAMDMLGNEIDDDNLADVPSEYRPPTGVLFRLICDGEIVAEETIESNEPVRLPIGYRARETEIELSGEIDIREVVVATSINELIEAQSGG